MDKVVVTCSRCGNEVEGAVDEHFTAGYYNVSAGEDGYGAWSRFAREGETILCDPCMWSDPEYKKIYSHDGEAAQWREEQGL